jgi:BlaI family penicillinase repressor
MSRNNKRQIRLSELEHTIMDFIWSNGPSNAETIRKGLTDRWPMKDSTARTILRRLENKGFLKHSLDGRTYVYEGVDTPQDLAVGAVRQIVDRFCKGSVESLLVGMIQNEVIEEKELERLAEKIRRARGES